MATIDAPAGAPPGELDPFERFNRAMGVGTVTNPYPDFAALREQPIVPADIRRMFGIDVGLDEIPLGDLPPVFTVTTFDAAQEVLHDGKRFSSAGYAPVMGPVMGHTILEMDEPEHHTYRGLIQQAFTRKAMERWELGLVQPIVDELIDGFAPTGTAELVRQLTFPFPVNVIAGLLGLPRDDLPQFHRWAVELISVSVDFEGALAASAALRDYLLGFVDERRVTPGDDLISVLAQAEHEGQRLTDDEILAFCRLLLPAGAETTYRSSSNLLCGLLTHPDQLDALRADRSLFPQAIEEGLRWECPLLTIMRLATEDTDVGGVPVPQGAVLVLNVGSANHDPSRWDNPDAFDIFRPQHPHVAFATGGHMCLGMHLARMETRVALDRVFDRLPGLRLDPDADPPVISGMTFRAPTALPVIFDSPG
ncbi:MAG: cytochrome P450 [Acidimicrobiales bacterium]